MKTYTVTGCREMWTLHTFTIRAASELAARKKFRAKFKRGVSVTGVKAIELPPARRAPQNCQAWPRCDCIMRGNTPRDCSA